MARSERQVPDLYFGRPGALVTLPWPRGGMNRVYERQTYDFITGSGNHQVSALSTGSRARTISWDALHQDTFTRIEQFRTGMNGPGPWVLIDPSAPNLLPANVASAGGLHNNITSFFSSGITSGGTASAQNDPAFVHRPTGWRSIRWRFTVAPVTAPYLYPIPLYRSWYGQPVAPGLSYAFSSWIRADGIVDTSITVSMRLGWYDAAGALLSEITTGDIAVSAWQRLSVIGVAPAGAAYVRPSWIAVGSSITVGGSLYIDEPLLEQDTVVNDWAPGTGIRPVEITDLSETAPFAARFRDGPTLTLRELAR